MMKNSITIGIHVFAVLFLFAIKASAQSGEVSGTSGIRYSIGADLGLPTGNLNNDYKLTLGGSIQADIPIVSKNLYFTVNTGYTSMIAKKQQLFMFDDIHFIPAKIGIKYFFIPGVYVQGDAGIAFLLHKDYYDKNKIAAFIFAPQAGMLIPLGVKNYIDAGLRYETMGRFNQNSSKSSYVALRLAYAFKL